jgi:hypothetical protein
MRTKKVVIEPYGTPLYIATSDKAWDMLGLDREDCVGAVTAHHGRWYVALPEIWDESTVWHEAHHVARMIAHVHGVETTGDDHEIDAYTQEYVVRLIKQAVYPKQKS